MALFNLTKLRLNTKFLNIPTLQKTPTNETNINSCFDFELSAVKSPTFYRVILITETSRSKHFKVKFYLAFVIQETIYPINKMYMYLHINKTNL